MKKLLAALSLLVLLVGCGGAKAETEDERFAKWEAENEAQLEIKYAKASKRKEQIAKLELALLKKIESSNLSDLDKQTFARAISSVNN